MVGVGYWFEFSGFVPLFIYIHTYIVKGRGQKTGESGQKVQTFKYKINNGKKNHLIVFLNLPNLFFDPLVTWELYCLIYAKFPEFCFFY